MFRVVRSSRGGGPVPDGRLAGQRLEVWVGRQDDLAVTPQTSGRAYEKRSR